MSLSKSMPEGFKYPSIRSLPKTIINRSPNVEKLKPYKYPICMYLGPMLFATGSERSARGLSCSCGAAAEAWGPGLHLLPGGAGPDHRPSLHQDRALVETRKDWMEP